MYKIGYQFYNPKYPAQQGTITDIMWSNRTRQDVYTVQYTNGMYRRYFECGLDRMHEVFGRKPVNTYPSTDNNPKPYHKVSINSNTNYTTNSNKKPDIIINLYFE